MPRPGTTTSQARAARRGRWCVAAITGLAAVWAAGTASAATCADLQSAGIPQTEVRSAELTSASASLGRIAPADTPAFCRVRGVVRPVAGSEIGLEVWLPAAGWNGKIYMAGNGGYSSALPYGPMGEQLRRGYAVVGTDTGHEGADPSFARGRREAIADWGYRAVHESIVAAKQIVRLFYGEPPRWAYFAGCSTGGQQGLTEAQRFPDDFDGIVAGDPGHNRTHLNAAFLWRFLSNHAPGDNTAPILSADKIRLVGQAAFERCRRRNGAAGGGLATDAFLNDPLSCRFDPGVLRCRGDDRRACLTAAELAAVRRMYAELRDPRTGEVIYPAWPVGSEAAGGGERPGWVRYWSEAEDETRPVRTNFWRDWAFDDPSWNWWRFDFSADMKQTDRALGPLVNAMDADLRPFRSSGAKLIQYHGMADPVVSVLDSVDYYERVEANDKVAGALTASYYRLFLVPGMAHCAGGPGPDQLQVQEALEAWVERGRAPDRIIAAKFAAAPNSGGSERTHPLFTRPVCPYPRVARYRPKSGPPESAAAFECLDAPRPRFGRISAAYAR